MADGADGAIALHLSVLAVWIACVATATFVTCRYFLDGTGSASNFFQGGRSLTWFMVGGSLLMTNISTEQLVGLNGLTFKDQCLAASAWELCGCLGMAALACFFLPMYFKMELATTPEYLKGRFDESVRTIISLISLVFLGLGLAPAVLYSGALFMMNLFDVEDSVPLWLVCALLALTCAPASFLGTQVCTVSDFFGSLGAMVVGTVLLCAAVAQIGGVSALFDKPEYLQVFAQDKPIYDDQTGSRSAGPVSAPWHTLLVGMPLNILFYFCFNQLIVQRALSARSLAEAQKGVLFGAVVKVATSCLLCLLGIIALVMQDQSECASCEFHLHRADDVFGKLVSRVMPRWALGFFAGAILSTVVSSVNASLNSASTVFGLDVYRACVAPTASDAQVLRGSKVFAMGLLVFACVLAPSFALFDNIFNGLMVLKLVTSLPVLALFLIGIFTVKPDAFAAKFGVACSPLACVAFKLVPVHDLHRFTGSFFVIVLCVLLATHSGPLRRLFNVAESPVPYDGPPAASSIGRPWRYSMALGAALVAVTLGIQGALQSGVPELVSAGLLGWMVLAGFMLALPVVWASDTSGASQSSPDKKPEEPTKAEDLADKIPAAPPQASSSALAAPQNRPQS